MGDPLLPPPPPKKKPTDGAVGLLPPPPPKETEEGIVTPHPEAGSAVPGLKFAWEKQPARVDMTAEANKPAPQPAMTGDITGVYKEEIVQPEPLKEAREWTRRENLKASGIENYQPVRSQNVDVETLVSKASEPGKPTVSVESAQAGEAIKAIEDDYFDFLQNTNPEKAEYERNRIEAIREQVKNGDSVSSEEYKILRDFRQEAIEAKNAKAEYDILSVRQSSDVDTFQKQSAVLMNQLQQGKKELEALNLDPSGNNPPNKIAAAEKIVERQNALVQKIDQLRGQTGFTEDKENTLYNSARSMTSPVVSEYVEGQFPELKAKEEKIKQEKADEYLSQMQGPTLLDPTGLGKKALTTAKGFAGSVGNAIISIAQVPKVVGDALGDTDYDWKDELYNSTESFLQSKEGRFGRPEMEGREYSELPLSYRMSRLFGEATGSVAVFAAGGLGGGATKAGQFLATTGTAWLTGEADAYKDALAAGMNPKEAARAGTAVNTVTALIEGLIPDVKYFEPSAFRKSVMSAIKAGSTPQMALKNAIAALPESAKAYLKTATKEGAEEFAGQLGSDIAKETINTMVKNDYQNVWDKEAYFESVLGGFMAGGGMQVFSRPNQKSPIQEDVLLSSVERKDAITGLLETTDPEKAAEVAEVLDHVSEIHEGLKNAPSFEALPREKQAHVLSELHRKTQLEESAKTIGVEDSQITEQVKQIDENVKSILDTGFTPVELEEQKIKAEEEELQAQPETLTEAEVLIKQSIGEQIYTPQDIDSMIEKDEVIEECPPGTVKAKHGLKTGFKPGGKWELVTEFKGKTHEEGGIDIEISGGKIKRSDEGGMKLEDGGYWQIQNDMAMQQQQSDQVDKMGTSIAGAIGPQWAALAQIGIAGSNKIEGDGTNTNKVIAADIADPFNQFKGNDNFGDWATSMLLPGVSSIIKGRKKAQQQRDLNAALAVPTQAQESLVPTAQQQQTMAVAQEVSALNGQGANTIQMNGGTYGYDVQGNFIKLA